MTEKDLIQGFLNGEYDLRFDQFARVREITNALVVFNFVSSSRYSSLNAMETIGNTGNVINLYHVNDLNLFTPDNMGIHNVQVEKYKIPDRTLEEIKINKEMVFAFVLQLNEGIGDENAFWYNKDRWTIDAGWKYQVQEAFKRIINDYENGIS